MKKLLFTLVMSLLCIGSALAEVDTYSPTMFGTTQNNAKYNSETGQFSWSASNSNNMVIVELTEEGGLLNYNRLIVKTSDLSTDGKYRILFKNANGTTVKQLEYTEAGEITIDLYALYFNYENTNNIYYQAKDVATIWIAGNSAEGSLTIKPSDVRLETDKHETVYGSKYYLNLNDPLTNYATWDNSSKTATWTKPGDTNQSRVLFPVVGDIKDMTKVTVTISNSSASCRVFLVTTDNKWINTNGGAIAEAGTDGGNAISSTSSTKTITLDLTSVEGLDLDNVQYVMVKAAQNAGENNTYAIESIVFSKPFDLTFDENGDACIYPVDLTVTGFIKMDYEGNITIDETSEETTAKFSASWSTPLDLTQVETITVYVENQPSSDDYYKYLAFNNGTKDARLYSSRYQCNKPNDNLTGSTSAISLNFEKNGTGTFSKLNFVRFSKENRTSGVENIAIGQDEANSEAEVVYYNLQGAKVANPEHGIFIRCQGGKATKVAL
jgi:hypothetical protein